MRSTRGRLAVLIAIAAVVAVVAALVISRRDDTTYASMPWSQALVSSDGMKLTLLVDPLGDPSCMTFDHIELTQHRDRYTAKAIFAYTKKYCRVPCPIGLPQTPHTITLSKPIAASDIDPASEPSCQRGPVEN